jgi:D-sedoheptulose 7-phosphate isomerase
VPGARPFRAISLVDNQALLTAQANDEGYDSVFVAQLESLLRPGDVVLGITASGNSPNLIEAFSFARAHGAVTVGLLGFDGGRLRELSDVAVTVRTAKGEYGPVEDLHLVIDHIVTNYLARWLASEVSSGR